jgi:peptidoglycan hydrolase-like protein with peptidoglycan-binding domain/DNA invertase Pin-like site-specific DNA recombinase
MRHRNWVPGIRAGAASLVAALALLCLPGTTIAGGSSAAAATASAATSAPLTRGVGFDRPGGAAQVRDLQRRLQELGQRPGPVDGLFGPLTEAAVERFQLAQGLDADGIVGPHTRRALRGASRPPLTPGAGYGQRGGSPRVWMVQRRLRQLGQRPGPVDGLFGPKTQAAVERFQRTSQLVADGVVGSHTLRALARAEHAGGGSPARSAAHARRPEHQTRAQAPQRPAGGTEARRPTTTSRGPSRAAGSERATRAHRGQPAGAREANHPAQWRLLAVVLLGLALLAIVAALALGSVRRRAAAPLAQATVGKTRDVARSLGRVPASLQAVGVGRRESRATAEPRAVASDRDRPRPSAPKRDQVRTPGASPRPAARPDTRGNGKGTQVLAYVSVPESGARTELRRQLLPIDALCRRRGWRLEKVARDVERRDGDESRPGLDYALECLARGEASCLIVAELGRLSRSAAELGRIIEWLRRHEIRLLALDIELDTATPVGEMAADALVSVGARERERLAALADQGPARDAFKAGALGRPAVGDIPALKKYIAALRSTGMTLQGIADRLNAEGVPTLRGGQKWRPSSVQAAVGYRRPPPRPARSRVNGGRSDVSGGAS